MTIINVKLTTIQASKPEDSFTRRGGMQMHVQTDMGEYILQLEKGLDGEDMFFEPTWGISGTELLDVCEKVQAIDDQYNEHCKANPVEDDMVWNPFNT